jgi:hypothetical protein
VTTQLDPVSWAALAEDLRDLEILTVPLVFAFACVGTFTLVPRATKS